MLGTPISQPFPKATFQAMIVSRYNPDLFLDYFVIYPRKESWELQHDSESEIYLTSLAYKTL